MVPSGEPAARHLRVLVADDESTIRDALCKFLEGEGFVIAGAAKNVGEAVELATLGAPDVALIDVQMPGGGGVRATEEIRKLSPSTKVIALSAHTERDVVFEMLRAGATGYLVKGAPVENILDAIERAMLGESTLSRQVTADVISELSSHLEREATDAEARREQHRRIHSTISGARLELVFQPIVDLQTRRRNGVEALARFPGDPTMPPDVWFAQAWEVGLGVELELLACRMALEKTRELPSETFLSLNISPQTALSPQFPTLLEGERVGSLVFEITEHARVDDYEALAKAFESAIVSGARIAVDDAGAGFASLRHILNLHPHVIKLDIDLVRGIHQDRSRRALAAALISFAAEMDCVIVAEGIETGEELGTLVALGVHSGQGYYLGRPGPLE